MDNIEHLLFLKLGGNSDERPSYTIARIKQDGEWKMFANSQMPSEDRWQYASSSHLHILYNILPQGV